MAESGDSKEGEPALYIKNELLTFVQYHVQRCVKKNIVEVVGRCFSENTIMQARDVLNLHFGDKMSAKLKQRRNAQDKMKAEVTVDDIVSAMCDLQHNKISTNFVAMDLQNMPNCDPKDVDNFAVLQRILVLEEKFRKFENNLSENVARTLKHGDELDAVTNNVKTHDALLQIKLTPPAPNFTEAASSLQSFSTGRGEKSSIEFALDNRPNGAHKDGDADKTITNADKTIANADETFTNRPDVSDMSTDSEVRALSGNSTTDDTDTIAGGTSPVAAGGAVHVVPNSENPEMSAGAAAGQKSHSFSTVVKTQVPRSTAGGLAAGGSTAGSLAAGTSSAGGAKSRATGGNDWNLIGRGGKIVNNSNQGKTSNARGRKRMIQGSVQSDVIRGAPPPKRDFFISRVLPQTRDTDFRNFINDNVVKNFDLTLTSNVNAKFKSYRLSVDVVDKDKIFRPEVWPLGVKLQRWRLRSDKNTRTQES